MSSMQDFSAKVVWLAALLEDADAVLVGAGAGLSAAAGMTYAGDRFDRYFADFRDAFGIQDMYAGGFYPLRTQEQYWAWWSRAIWVNRYLPGPTELYLQLQALIGHKDYFVITTNMDHQFQLAGFDKKRLFFTQGDYGLLQCRCVHKCR